MQLVALATLLYRVNRADPGYRQDLQTGNDQQTPETRKKPQEGVPIGERKNSR